jgi:hypothetical protein
MDFTWVKRKDCKVLLQDSTLVDVYRVQSINIPRSEAIANLKERLLMYGYKQWLAEG